jgi:hypothetical protein
VKPIARCASFVALVVAAVLVSTAPAFADLIFYPIGPGNTGVSATDPINTIGIGVTLLVAALVALVGWLLLVAVHQGGSDDAESVTGTPGSSLASSDEQDRASR